MCNTNEKRKFRQKIRQTKIGQFSPLTLIKNVEKIAKPIERRRLKSREYMIKKNVLDLQRLKQQKQYSNPCSKTVKKLPVYGDRVNLFEKGHLSE